MHFVYIIRSEKTGKFYIGVTSNSAQRLRHHNSGANRSTRNKGPWKFVHEESFITEKEAWLRERQVKKYKGGDAFRKLINTGGVA